MSFFRKKVTFTVLTQNFISSFNQKMSSSAFTSFQSILMLGSEWSNRRCGDTAGTGIKGFLYQDRGRQNRAVVKLEVEKEEKEGERKRKKVRRSGRRRGKSLYL